MLDDAGRPPGPLASHTLPQPLTTGLGGRRPPGRTSLCSCGCPHHPRRWEGPAATEGLRWRIWHGSRASTRPRPSHLTRSSVHCHTGVSHRETQTGNRGEGTEPQVSRRCHGDA